MMAADPGGGVPLLRIWRSDDQLEPGVRMAFVATARDGDELAVSQGIHICVDRDLVTRLDGLVLDRRPEDCTALFFRAAT